MRSIFIAYALEDSGFVEALRRSLRELGVSAEAASNDPSSGTAWAEAVRASVERTDAIVLVLPEGGSPGANNAFFEAGVGHALGKPVLAVLPEQRSARLRELPSELLEFAIMDAANRTPESVARTLVRAMEPA